MRALRTMSVIAVAVLLMAACSKSGTNSNAPANTNTRPANANSAASTPTNTATGSKKAVQPTTTAASGENVYTHEEGGIQFEVPPTWKAEADGDTMSLSAPDGSVSVVLTVVEQANLENAAGAIDSELEKVMQNVEAKGEVEQGTHNGMPMFSTEGTGEINGSKLMWGTALLMAKKPVLVYAFAAPGLWEKHQTDVGKLIQSIKPAN